MLDIQTLDLDPQSPKPRDTIESEQQIRYCEPCEQILVAIFSAGGEKERDKFGRAMYKLDFATLIPGKGCCCCELLFRICKNTFHGMHIDRTTSSSESSAFPPIIIIYYNSKANYITLRADTKEFIFSAELMTAHRGDYSHLISSSTNSTASWTLARKWIKDCKTKHKCAASSKHKLPTRLIRIDRDLEGYHPRLVETVLMGDVAGYCTLSHCWGDGRFMKLLQSNYAQFQDEIPYHLLSAVFQDAICAAHTLSYRYIWIDSLCIIQEDDADWLKESGTMSDVYAGSDLNLAASTGKDARSGLFTTRDFTTVAPCLSSWLKIPTPDFVIYYGPTWEEMITNVQLGSRGWVFQERFLAPRTLHFGPDQ